MKQYRRHAEQHANLEKHRPKFGGKTVPWWPDDLTMRKRTNALRRLYQRTKNNNDLRDGPIRHSEDSISSSHKKEKQCLGRNIALKHHRPIHGMGYKE